MTKLAGSLFGTTLTLYCLLTYSTSTMPLLHDTNDKIIHRQLSATLKLNSHVAM